MMTTRYWLQRGRNGLRKIAAGLRPFNESVWPGVENDLFIAHRSLYQFGSRFAAGADVLDAGCGTGYGCRILSDAGARHVLGVDVDRMSVAYARRHFGSASVSFEVRDCEQLVLDESSLGLVFSSNVLEHLLAPSRLLQAVHRGLRKGGTAVFAVPPITSPAAAAVHHGIHYHRSNLSVMDWYALLGGLPWAVEVHSHEFVGSGPRPDFASPFRSALCSSDFSVEPSSISRIYQKVPTTVVFVAVRD